MINTQIVLKSRPVGDVRETDFAVATAAIPPLDAGSFLVGNIYLSLDAGFRKWMNEGADDNYLTTMQLGEPAQSIVLGRVVASRHDDFPVGVLVLGRKAWESFSRFDGTDFVQKLDHDPSVALHEYLATMGPTGMTAYFGLLDVGKPKPGETVLVSAAGGAVGSVVGQLAKIMGCRTVGIAGSPEKCRWLKEELGYDAAIDHRDPVGLAAQIAEELPDGFDIYFDNVGGAMLDTAVQYMRQGARIVLCGAVSEYDRTEGAAGMFHMWDFIVKRASAAGFMFSDYVDHYPAAIRQLSGWMQQGKLRSVVQVYEGIEETPRAFCEMLSGKSRGKCVVKL